MKDEMLDNKTATQMDENAVLISIHPKWCKLIASGEKTIEVRKTRPKLDLPFKCYIYQTKAGKVGTGLFTADGEIMGRSVKNGKVIAEFVCERISEIMISCSDPDMRGLPFPGTGLTDREIMDYLGNGKTGYGWHISNLVIYDKPKELSDFQLACDHKEDCCACRRWNNKEFACISGIKRAPQSWCYVVEDEK